MAKSLSNALTLVSYETKLDEYLEATASTVDAELREFLDGAFEDLPEGSRILELGAGFGRDALYLQSKGFDVLATDAAEGFLQELQRRGIPAERLNILEDPIPPAEAIYANAVFLHLSRLEFLGVLLKLQAALQPGGSLVFTLKEGSGEEWSSEKLDAPRYYVYWQEDALRELLAAVGFRSVSVSRTSASGSSWLMVVAKLSQSV